MTAPKEQKFYIGFIKRDGQTIGHAFSTQPKKFDYENENSEEEAFLEKKEAEKEHSRIENDFITVFDDFVATVESYRQFMPFTLTIAPQIASAVAEREIVQFAKTNGAKRDDLSVEESEVYELDFKFFGEYRHCRERAISALGGAHLLPEVMIIGLISAFDSFLSSLLRVVINKHQEIVLTSQKQITFQELLEFKSIDDAKSTLIDREIEAVIRRSHHEQFDWMQHHLNVKLKEGLKVWSAFIEVCERRNLFTHTGGIVSNQYLKNCTEHKYNVSGIKVGQKLGVEPSYFKRAVDIIYEIGLKLCYVLWRKFNEIEIETADRKFNERCMELISVRSYQLAEALLLFSRTVPKVTDNIRRMMVVNLANAIRLQGRDDEAKKLLDTEELLDTEDWSATNDEFTICVASVRGDLNRVLELMDHLGTRFAANQFREWPVFRRTRSDPRFIEKFEAIYGEPFVLAKKKIEPEFEITTNSEVESEVKKPTTVH
jgi:hypothetical protein